MKNSAYEKCLMHYPTKKTQEALTEGGIFFQKLKSKLEKSQKISQVDGLNYEMKRKSISPPRLKMRSI